jgi:MarR family
VPRVDLDGRRSERTGISLGGCRDREVDRERSGSAGRGDGDDACPFLISSAPRSSRSPSAYAKLKPLVAEYQELQHIAQRLGLNPNDDATAAAMPSPALAETARPRRRASPTKVRSAAPTRDESGNGATAQTPAATTPARPVRSPRNAADNGRGSKRTSRRQQDVLRLVNARPGITVSDIAKQLGVDATGVPRPVHKLEQQGAIIKEGAALQPADR